MGFIEFVEFVESVEFIETRDWWGLEISRDTIETQCKFKCQSRNVKIQRTIDPPHSSSLPPGERESLDEIATGFALAVTRGESLTMTPGWGAGTWKIAVSCRNTG